MIRVLSLVFRELICSISYAFTADIPTESGPPIANFFKKSNIGAFTTSRRPRNRRVDQLGPVIATHRDYDVNI